MRRYLLLLLCLMPLWATAQTTSLNSLYLELDNAIAHADDYLAEKNHRIEGLQKDFDTTISNERRYDIANRLYEEYAAFMNDSAIAWASACISIAEKAERPDLKIESQLKLARQYTTSGFYSEAENYFNAIDKKALKGDMLTEYYLGLNQLYGEMGYYTKDPHMSDRYYQLSGEYRDSVYHLITPGSITYLNKRVTQLCNDKQYTEALKWSDQWLNKVKEGTHDYAIMAFFRSEIYKGLDNKEEQKHWLALSALSDVKCAIMDQASLWSLASILSEEGDVDRAYRYVEYSWDCTSRFSTHLRSWTVSPILTMINASYKDKLRKANSRLRWLIGTVSLMALFLLASLIWVSRKRKQLAIARNELQHSNNQLSALNAQLSVVNSQLSTLNVQLKDSNRVKDEYIGKFLSTCSEYIDKLDNYRKKINRKLKANQTADLLKLTSSEQLKEDELKELFSNFDTVFLSLFPTFIQEFNALLKPEERITPPVAGALTTDLRIFALIRLGIEESSRIADFLHYSPNSIYNYRARIKNKALCDRDDFEPRVKDIGLSIT